MTEVPSQSSLPPSLSPVTCNGAPSPRLVFSIITRCPPFLGFLSVSTADVGWITLCPGGGPVCDLAASLSVYPLNQWQLYTPQESPGLIPTLKSHWYIQSLVFVPAPLSIWDLSSLTRDQTHDPCIGSTESKLLDYQGSSYAVSLIKPLALRTGSRVISFISSQQLTHGCACNR